MGSFSEWLNILNGKGEKLLYVLTCYGGTTRWY